MQFSSIWPLDKALSGATIPGQSGMGAMAMMGYSVFSKAPPLLQPDLEIV